jgi:integrase
MFLHDFPRNPASLVEKGTIPRGEVVYFTHDEVKLVCRHAPAADARLFLVMSRVGLRRCEMVALRWRDVNFEAKQVHVRRSFVEGEEGPTKDYEDRRVPLSKDAADILLPMSEFSIDPDDLVFPRADGSHQNPDNLSKRFTEAKTAAKLEHRGTLENLRHTFATHAAAAFPLPKVQKWLGHSDVKTTMTYVGVLDSSDDAEALDAFYSARKVVA